MSRDFSRSAVAALALALMVSPAFAEDGDLVESAKKAERAKQTLGNKVDAITEAANGHKERALQAADDAKERALQAADDAKEHSQEAADQISERYEEMKANAAAYGQGIVDSASQGVGKVGAGGAAWYAQGKQWLRDALQGMRDALRDSLLGAANALDNKAKDAREGARKAHWEKLKARYSLPDHAPTMELSEELREHEERLARLHRVRELAESVDDQASVVRSDHLAEREYARHRRHLQRLLEKERREQALLDGEQLSYGGEGE